MSILYHLDMANVVADAFEMLFMGNTFHAEENKKLLAKDKSKLARLRLVNEFQ